MSLYNYSYNIIFYPQLVSNFLWFVIKEVNFIRLSFGLWLSDFLGSLSTSKRNGTQFEIIRCLSYFYFTEVEKLLISFRHLNFTRTCLEWQALFLKIEGRYLFPRWPFDHPQLTLDWYFGAIFHLNFQVMHLNGLNECES